nr:MAG TPA: hypothetical protein [Caudoviricetes sp.]
MAEREGGKEEMNKIETMKRKEISKKQEIKPRIDL